MIAIPIYTLIVFNKRLLTKKKLETIENCWLHFSNFTNAIIDRHSFYIVNETIEERDERTRKLINEHGPKYEKSYIIAKLYLTHEVQELLQELFKIHNKIQSDYQSNQEDRQKKMPSAALTERIKKNNLYINF